MRLLRSPLPFAALIAAALPAAGQGADLCASAQPIAGTGLFAFDNTQAAMDGAGDPLCYSFGTQDIDLDVWFSWTAPASALYTLATCNQTTVDTKIAVYDGSCTGPMLACNDDTCGLQSSVDWQATSGSTYILRIGVFPGAAGGTGSIEISDNLPVQNPANGHHYLAVASPGISWDAARAAAAATTYQGVPGHLATLTDQQENDFVFALSSSGVHNFWIGGFQNTNSPNYSEPAGGWEWITGEPWGYTNWLPGEPNNTGAFGAEDYLELLDGPSFGQTWNDVAQQEHPAGYVIEYDTGEGTGYCFGDGTGAICPCGNFGGAGQGCANGTGLGALLSNQGSTSVAAADLVLTGANLAPGQPGLYFQGDNAVQSGNGVPFGDGLRCAGGNVVRLQVRQADAGGASATTVDIVARAGVQAGDVKRYQLWYRDPLASPCGTGFNLSNGVEITWTP